MKINSSLIQGSGIPYVIRRVRAFNQPDRFFSFYRYLFSVILFMLSFILFGCTKTENKKYPNQPPEFETIQFNYKDDLSDLVRIGKIEEDRVIFTESKNKIFDAIVRDVNYKYIFEEQATFDFNFSSLDFYYENLDYIYLYIEGIVHTHLGNTCKKIILCYLMAPDQQGIIFNTYSNIDLCVSSGCSHCHPDRELGIVVGCTCTSHDGTCEHSVVTKTRGEYFILPMK